MIPFTITDDSDVLPTFENRFSAYLHVHGVDLPPGEYVVREARLIRWLGSMGFDEQTRAEVLACVQEYPQLLLGEEWGPTPFTQLEWNLVFPGPAEMNCDSSRLQT